MAISFKSLNGIAALKKVGLADDLLKGVETTGVEVKLTSTEFKFSHPAYAMVLSVPVNLNDLQMLNAGTLEAAKKASMAYLLSVSVKELLDHIGPDAKPEPATVGLGALPKLEKAPVSAPPFVASKQNKETTPGVVPAPKAEAAAAPFTGWANFPKHLMKSATPVPLAAANRMYQPVNGTSKGSRYYLVAGRSDLGVAARYDGHKLSVRIEGTGLAKWSSRMQACGFDGVGPASKHTSLHLECGDPILASKTLGAILMGLNIEMETPLPQLAVIA